MGILKRILGICETKPPANRGCWDFKDGIIQIDLSLVPELAKPGGAIRLEGREVPERVLVLHGTDGRFYAYRNRCLHMGRRIDPIPGGSEIRCCSVSKATYDYTGKVVSGPAKGPLKAFRVGMEEGKLKIFLT